jgi:hypothetical protein
MFIFFSNRLGCGGSLLVSAVVTGILLLLLGVINWDEPRRSAAPQAVPLPRSPVAMRYEPRR